MGKLTGKGMAEFAISKLGTKYVYGAKGSNGKFTQVKLDSLAKSYPSMFTTIYKAKAKKFIGQVCCDCSGISQWYTGRVLGSAQLFSSASKKGVIRDIDKAPIGSLLYKSGHIGVYIGNGYCVECKGIDYGCVKTKVSATKWTHWLMFDYIDYDEIKTPTITSKKKVNPYKKPTTTVRKGDSGESVKWLQFELQEAGYNKVAIDGKFGSTTLKYLKKFQTSSKIEVDGLCGSETIKELVADK